MLLWELFLHGVCVCVQMIWAYASFHFFVSPEKKSVICTLKVVIQQQDIHLITEKLTALFLLFKKGSKTCIKRVPRVTPRLICKGFFVDFKMLYFPYSPPVHFKIIIFISNLVHLQILVIRDFTKAFIY